MFRAAADGRLDFVAETSEYARRARLTKELFLRHGFRIVYDKDQDEAVSDGFFYTVGYGDLTSSELLSELLLYGICAISLTTTGSRQPGIRVCVSQLNRPEQFDLLEARLTAFGQNPRYAYAIHDSRRSRKAHPIAQQRLHSGQHLDSRSAGPSHDRPCR